MVDYSGNVGTFVVSSALGGIGRDVYAAGLCSLLPQDISPRNIPSIVSGGCGDDIAELLVSGAHVVHARRRSVSSSAGVWQEHSGERDTIGGHFSALSQCGICPHRDVSL